MECKRCNTATSEEESRPVGAWRFCIACFEALMHNADETRAEKAQPEPEARPALHARIGVSVSQEAESAMMESCTTCGRVLEADKFETLVGLKICPQCYADLQMSSHAPDQDEEQPEATAELDPAEPAVHPGQRSMRCAGCTKRVPERGVRMVAGKPYCPDCYYTIKDAADKAAFEGAQEHLQQVAADAALADAGIRMVGAQASSPPTAAAAPVARGVSADYERCGACALPVRSLEIEALQGFRICSPCRSTDAELAVEVARKRHKLWLKRQAGQLGDE